MIVRIELRVLYLHFSHSYSSNKSSGTSEIIPSTPISINFVILLIYLQYKVILLTLPHEQVA